MHVIHFEFTYFVKKISVPFPILKSSLSPLPTCPFQYLAGELIHAHVQHFSECCLFNISTNILSILYIYRLLQMSVQKWKVLNKRYSNLGKYPKHVMV